MLPQLEESLLRDVLGGLQTANANFCKIPEPKAVLTIEAFESLRIAPAQFAPKFFVTWHRRLFSTLIFAPKGQIVHANFTRREAPWGIS